MNGSEIQFKTIDLEDQDLIRSFYQKLNSRSCDDCFSNLYLWKHMEPMEYALVDDVLILKSRFEHFSFRFPIGPREKILPALELCLKLSEEKKVPFRIRLITREQFELCEQLNPGRFLFTEERDAWDYVYEREKLEKLSGRRYHGQKNHVNKFMRDYPDWSIEPITQENLDDCFQMGMVWRRQNDCDQLYEKRIEMCVALNALRLFRELHLTGALLRVNGNCVAYTVGEKLNEDTFVVHIEKALAEVNGAYPMINREFVHMAMGDFTYVNREDDTGDPGLRQAKESYHPAMMVEKGSLTLI